MGTNDKPEGQLRRRTNLRWLDGVAENQRMVVDRNRTALIEILRRAEVRIGIDSLRRRICDNALWIRYNNENTMK